MYSDSHFSLFFLQQAKAQQKEMEVKKATLKTQGLETETARINLTAKTRTTKDSSTVSETSEHQNNSDKKEETNYQISLSSVVDAQDSNESTEASLDKSQQGDKNIPRSPPTPGKPLRERQLLPLPHLGDIIPPPAEFAEYAGKESMSLTRHSNKVVAWRSLPTFYACVKGRRHLTDFSS